MDTPTITVTIRTSNAAFNEAPGAFEAELARIFRDLAKKVEEGIFYGNMNIRDANENKVGTVEVTT